MTLALLTGFLFHPLELVLHIQDATLSLLEALSVRPSIFPCRPQLLVELILLQLHQRQVSLRIFGSGSSRLEPPHGLLGREEAGLEGLDLCVGFRNGVVEKFELVKQSPVLLNLQGIFGLELLLVHFQTLYPLGQIEAVPLGVSHVRFMPG
jgi:hypothetical protein